MQLLRSFRWLLMAFLLCLVPLGILIWRAPAAGKMAAAMKEFVTVARRYRDRRSIPLESEA